MSRTSKSIMVSSVDSSRHSSIYSSKSIVCSSKTTKISLANPSPLMDEFAQVSAPWLTSTTTHNLIRDTYDHYQNTNKSMHWTFGLV